jgi:hypothetical protein
VTPDDEHDQIFGPGDEDALRSKLRSLDTRILFEGRTVVVSAVFHTIVDPKIVSERVRRAAAGPLLRMAIGGLERRQRDHALLTKSFVNTDEEVEVVAARVAAVMPEPARVEGGLVDERDAVKLWIEFHRTIDGGD